LDVSWVPINTLGEGSYTTDILSSAVPPPLKVAKVAPAWNLTTKGAVNKKGGYTLTRTGNILRVYLERPWYQTGAGEMVGVVTTPSVDEGATQTAGIPPAINFGLTSLIGFDPISVPSPNPDDFVFPQAQLQFISPTPVPNTATVIGGNPVGVAMPPQDPDGELLYLLYGYVPQYDPIDQLWYVDIQLDPNSFQSSSTSTAYALPPGYFLQLALVRFQPYSTGGQSYTDPTTGESAVNPPNWTSAVTQLTMAQPVSNRVVTVTSAPNNAVTVKVTGPAYSGWRSTAGIDDPDNPNATHPNSSGSPLGSPDTSTIVVQVQINDLVENYGIGGDFGWSTQSALDQTLIPTFSSTESTVTWSTASAGITLPNTGSAIRLCISEFDYLLPAGDPLGGDNINTNYRRSFVVHIPVQSAIT
jgi:hypothetical protein